MIGVPFTTPGDINRKVQEEHMRYLVAELDTRVRILRLFFVSHTCCTTCTPQPVAHVGFLALLGCTQKMEPVSLFALMCGDTMVSQVSTI